MDHTVYHTVVLKIDGAKRFINKERLGKHTLDNTIVEFGGNIRLATVADRTDTPDDTLPLHCVANAIAVLCGDRPIPTKRKHSPLADYPAFEKYVDMARRAHIHLTTTADNTSIMQTVKASMMIRQQCEAEKYEVSCKRDSTNATMIIDGKEYGFKYGFPSHYAISLCWPHEVYKEFDVMCKTSISEDYATRLTFPETLSALRQLYVQGSKQVVEFTSKIEQSAKPGSIMDNEFVKIVGKGIVANEIFRSKKWSSNAELKSWLDTIPVHSDPQLTWVSSGYIYLKATTEEVKWMLKGPEFATILDGGALYPMGLDDGGQPREIKCNWKSEIRNWNERFESYPIPYEPAH
jgi:hypothetical protein